MMMRTERESQLLRGELDSSRIDNYSNSILITIITSIHARLHEEG